MEDDKYRERKSECRRNAGEGAAGLSNPKSETMTKCSNEEITETASRFGHFRPIR